MSLALTDRQKNELNVAILEYMLAQGEKFAESANVFKKEGSITSPIDANKGLLEKKWISVIRLQKRVMDLEAKIEMLQQQKSLGTNGSVQYDENSFKDSKLLPKAPAKCSLSGHRAPITAVACHPLYSLVASSSEDSTIKLWDHETMQYERTLKGHTGIVTGISFDMKGSLLASCAADLTAKLWDMATYACVKTLKGHDHTVSSIKFVPSGDQVLTCSRDTTVKLWEVSTGYCIRTYSGHTDWVKCISVSIDGMYVASSGSDMTIKIWIISTGQIVQVCKTILFKYFML
jgi:platelet-activating factor acetylhydrolase IB subunit alpha